jgi:outer membrane protein TolC
MKKVALLLFLLLSSASLLAQQVQKLSFEDYMKWVQDFHPISIQADLNLRLGQMEVRKARGGFDPMLYGNLDKKEFNQSTYFEKRETGVLVPTWMGVELMGNFEQNSGAFLNSESSVPTNGLLSAGAAVNLGQGLFLDDRRATLQKAKLYEQATVVERLNLRNELNLQATAAYWKWAAAYENKLVLEEGVKLAEVRFNGIKRSYELGDQAAIDTVEALSQLLNRQYRLQLADITFFENTQVLNTYLWNDSGEPMLLDSAIIPQALSQFLNPAPEAEELRTLVGRHPELLLTDFDLASLNVEKRLRTQQLLPVVKLKYNFLTENLADARPSPLFENNYRWGVTVYTPLFLRKTRGELGSTIAKLEIKQTGRNLKEQQLRTKLEAELNSWNVLNQQVRTLAENVKSLEALLTGETRRFEIGESSLFLVNAREVAVFDARVTLNELSSRLQIAYAKARFAAGVGFAEN